HLVARSFTYQLPLELRKPEENVQGQPAERRAGVELLGDRDETYLVLFEDTEYSGEVQQSPAQPVDLVHHQAIEFARFDRTQKLCQCRPVHVGAGETAVVIEIRQ